MSNKQDHIVATIQQYIETNILYDDIEIALTADLPLFEQRLIDSLQLIQIISFLQETFDVTMEPTELVLENFATIHSMAALVSSKIQNQS